jgi:hypothetical protein
MSDPSISSSATTTTTSASVYSNDPTNVIPDGLSQNYIKHYKKILMEYTDENPGETFDTYKEANYILDFDNDEEGWKYYIYLFPNNEDAIAKKALMKANEEEIKRQKEIRNKYNRENYSLPANFRSKIVIERGSWTEPAPDEARIQDLIEKRLRGKIIKSYADFMRNVGNLGNVIYSKVYASIFTNNRNAKGGKRKYTKTRKLKNKSYRKTRTNYS